MRYERQEEHLSKPGEFWEAQYLLKGEEGIRHPEKNGSYSPEEKYEIIQSMSKKGNCLDNAKTENLFSKMKKEIYYGHENDFHSYEEVKKTVDEYVRWYNEERIVTRLGSAPVGHRSIASIPMLC